MPPVSHTSPLTSQPVHPSYIHTTHLNFVDNHGRILLLRGVNLSGASKAPIGQLSHQLEDFWEDAESGGKSFVGRPLRLDDGSADVHLARLRGWGFNLLRLPFTWEALEREGPGKYDYEYMDYLIQVLVKCREHGFKVFMDPHQDCWSRFSGGSGAPFWTLPACSINHQNITATQAAVVHSEYPYAHAPAPDHLPAMIWSTNYGRLFSQTIFTLFFAGRDFAPDCIIDGVNIQDWLQGHFFDAVQKLAEKIAQFEEGSLRESCIIGWDSLNEPFEGLVGWGDISLNPTSQGSTLKKGTYPTPVQSMRLGMGQAQTVENWSFGTFGPSRDGWVDVDPKGYKVWATAEELGEVNGVNERWGWTRGQNWSQNLGRCIWANHGVWDVETGFVLRADYFKYRPIRSSSNEGDSNMDVELVEVEYLKDYWKPFYLSYTRAIRPSHPESIIFIQPPVFAPPPTFTADELQGRAAYSPHYYDGLTLVSRHWNWFNADALGLLRGMYGDVVGGKARAVKFGEGMVRKSLRQQLGYLADDVGALGVRDGDDEDEDDSRLEELSRSSATYPGALPGHLSTSTLPQPPAPKPKPTTGMFPSLIGEIGTPFDMDSKRSYGYTDGGKHTGDYSRQERALDASLNACDGAVTYLKPIGDAAAVASDGGDLSTTSKSDDKDKEEKRKKTERPVNYTIWTYIPDDHSWQWGDGWNLEDLSLWSCSDWVDPSSSSSSSSKTACKKAKRFKRKVVQEEEGLDSRAGLLINRNEDFDDAEDAHIEEVVERRRSIQPQQRSDLSLDTIANRRSIKSRRSNATLNSSTSTSSSLSLPLPTPTPNGYIPNPYTFLTNGSRAVRAFSRPWPTKVVGEPVDVRFDLAKGVFVLGIDVRKGDWVDYKDNEAVHTSDAGSDWEDERKATEVYLPLVHYASRELVDDAFASWGSAPGSGPSTRTREGHETEVDVETDSSTFVDADADSQNIKKLVDPSIRDTFSPSSPSSTASTPTSIPLIDVTVKISTGRYKIKGQRLLWWYDVPPGPSSSYTDDQPIRVELEVKRREGPLKSIVDWRKFQHEHQKEKERERRNCSTPIPVDLNSNSHPPHPQSSLTRGKEHARVLGVTHRRPRHHHQQQQGRLESWMGAGHGWCAKMCDDGACIVM